MAVNWVVLTYFVVGVFALAGLYRGWWKEGITTGVLVLLLVLLQQKQFAESLINTLNWLISIAWSFSPATFSMFFSDVLAIKTTAGLPYQLDGSDPSIWLMFMVLLVFLSTMTGRSSLPMKFKVTPLGGLFGALVGGFNGFIMLNLVREYMSGRNLPNALGPAQVARVGGQVAGMATSEVTIQATNLPNFTLMDSVLPWVIIIAGVAIFLTAMNNRGKFSKSKAGFIKIDYKTPYGYSG